MHIRRGALNWGVFLILAGAIPLAVRAGYLTEQQVDNLWSLWPLILVGIGVGLVLRRTQADFMGGLIIAVTVGLMAGGLLSTGVQGVSVGACGSSTGGVAFPARDGTIAGETGSIDLRPDCGDMTIAVASGAAWRLEGRNATGADPQVQADEASVRIESADRQGGAFGPFAQRESWDITVPDAPRIALTVHVNAGSVKADLAGADLANLEVQLNAGSATFDLGSARGLGELGIQMNAGSFGLTLPNVSFSGSIQANAGSVRMCAPLGAGLRLTTGNSIIASYDYAGHGLVQDGSTWTTPGYDTAAVKIDLRTQANAGSFSLDPEDGCD